MKRDVVALILKALFVYCLAGVAHLMFWGPKGLSLVDININPIVA